MASALSLTQTGKRENNAGFAGNRSEIVFRAPIFVQVGTARCPYRILRQRHNPKHAIRLLAIGLGGWACVSFAAAALTPYLFPMAAAHTNRLAREKSPYLLQHAHNPVDSFAWRNE